MILLNLHYKSITSMAEKWPWAKTDEIRLWAVVMKSGWHTSLLFLRYWSTKCSSELYKCKNMRGVFLLYVVYILCFVWFQHTLIFLLDHLALVVSQSERNKMSPQNLAICFGPVLMLQSEEGKDLDFGQPISVLKYLLEIWPTKSGNVQLVQKERNFRRL